VVEDKTNYYKGSRPDALTEWDTRKWTEEVGKNYAAKMMDIEYETAVAEQKAELRLYKKKAKNQLPQVEPVPLTIEQDQIDKSESVEA